MAREHPGRWALALPRAPASWAPPWPGTPGTGPWARAPCQVLSGRLRMPGVAPHAESPSVGRQELREPGRRNRAGAWCSGRGQLPARGKVEQGPLKDNEAEEVGNPDETPALSPEGGSEDAPADKSHLMGECPPPQGQRAGALGPPPLPSAAATQSLSSSLLSPWPQACSLADAEDILGRLSPGMKWSCSTTGRIDGATGLCHQHIHMSPSNRQRLPP